MSGTSIRESGQWFGIVAIVVTLGSIGLATLVSPAFTWSGNALSNLGVASHEAGTTTTALLFNGGLIVGGLLGIGFAASVAATERHPISRLGAVVFALAMASMAGVGVFPQDGPFHFQLAMGLYLLFSVAAVAFGIGCAIDSDRRQGAISAGLGLLNLALWTGWIRLRGIEAPGLAIPEILGAACISAWVLWQARRRLA